MDYRDWVPDEAIAELTLRRALHDSDDPIRLASDLLRENLPLSVMSMCHLATNSPTEAIRFQASKYIMDRTLGDTKNDLRTLDNRPAWERIYEDVLVEADKIIGGES